MIAQESGANVALIDQTGATNFAGISQTTNDANIGYIFQIGDGNRAGIVQK